MGAGLVRSTDNFGTTGERPSHPELLDHLALQFVADGWSIKQLVRSLVLSRTYQLAASATPDAARLDPDNRFFTHAPRRRLEAEEIRDAMLWTSGKLNLDLGGPNFGPSPNTPPPASEYAFVYADTRRSVYTPAFRNRRLELFEAFDFADINAPISQRAVTTVAPQALFLMNHPFVHEQAKLAAERVLAEAAPDDATRIDRAYRRALGRPPTERERVLARQFVSDGEGGATAEGAARLEAWSQLHQALFASMDFRYLN
jgi:hypothetical protein